MNATHAVIGLCPWPVKSTDTWMTSRDTCFLVSFNMVHSFENVCESTKVFWIIIKQVKALKKVKQELVTTKNNEETGDKKSSWQFENAYTARNLHNCYHCVSFLHHRTPSFGKCFCDYSALSKWRHWKTFHRNCIQKINKKRRSRDKK